MPIDLGKNTSQEPSSGAFLSPLDLQMEVFPCGFKLSRSYFDAISSYIPSFITCDDHLDLI